MKASQIAQAHVLHLELEQLEKVAKKLRYESHYVSDPIQLSGGQLHNDFHLSFSMSKSELTALLQQLITSRQEQLRQLGVEL